MLNERSLVTLVAGTASKSSTTLTTLLISASLVADNPCMYEKTLMMDGGKLSALKFALNT